MKSFASTDYNFMFDPKTGKFCRWGATPDQDPTFAPRPEILDIEVSEVCSQGCAQCYKSNTTCGTMMSEGEFRDIIDSMPWILQVAFGIGDIDANPALYPMMRYCRSMDIVPNITINGYRMADSDYRILAELCGAVSVSLYDKNVCYGALKKLGEAGLKQRNIHVLVSKETLGLCHEVIEDCKNDERLKDLNAIVFLLLKPKGDRNTYTAVSQEEYSSLIRHAIDAGAPFGADSCSAPKMCEALRGIIGEEKFLLLNTMIESCESSAFSSYINAEGKFFPCSFAEGQGEWEEGIDVTHCRSFVDDVWNHPKTLAFRDKLLSSVDCNGCRHCPLWSL